VGAGVPRGASTARGSVRQLDAKRAPAASTRARASSRSARRSRRARAHSLATPAEELSREGKVRRRGRRKPMAAAPNRLRPGGIGPARGLFERRLRRKATLEQTPVGSSREDDSPAEAWHLWGSDHLSASRAHWRVTSVLAITCLLLAALRFLSGDAERQPRGRHPRKPR
jgi:hypothetical protein